MSDRDYYLVDFNKRDENGWVPVLPTGEHELDELHGDVAYLDNNPGEAAWVGHPDHGARIRAKLEERSDGSVWAKPVGVVEHLSPRHTRGSFASEALDESGSSNDELVAALDELLKRNLGDFVTALKEQQAALMAHQEAFEARMRELVTAKTEPVKELPEHEDATFEARAGLGRDPHP